MTDTWTDARVSTLRQLVGAGLKATRIAAELGIGRGAVIGKLARMGVPLAGAWTVPIDPSTRPKKPKIERRAPLMPRKLKPPAPIDEPELTDLPPDESPFACSILELDETRCHWPMGTPGTDAFQYCGTHIDGGVYCGRHARLAYKRNAYRGTWG